MATTTAQKRQPTLDELLSAQVSTPDRWTNFLKHFVEPLKRETNVVENYDCPPKRKGFPLPDPYDVDPLAYSVDRIHFPSMMYTGKRLLYYTALLYHAEQRKRARLGVVPGTVQRYTTPLLREYDPADRERNLLSMVTITFDNRENDCRGMNYLWRNNLYIGYDSNMFQFVDRTDQVHRWKVYKFKQDVMDDEGEETNVRANSLEKREEFMRSIVPLQYYDWFRPDSQVNDWSFALDANTGFVFSWYANYLARVNQFDELTKKYATALQRIRQLEKMKKDNSTKFRDLYRNINDRYLSRDTYNAVYAPTGPNGRNDERLRRVREFNRLLEQLYQRFRSTLALTRNNN